ncbi:hypothetical protein INT47_011576 [Mucor saturninus]|uniref:Uncharacterized protein n=1 Tax=Mucor saturninus TaxID=64648 RepID=A0A8H7V2X4_9FUNG|nr:hypothetical protein INT47_011576 [Mucor saturninus]
MSTLNAFGFTTKRRGRSYDIPSKAIPSDNTVAFIQPIDLPKRKIIPKKTITAYFSPVEEEPLCVIRKKIPMMEMVSQIQLEYALDSDIEVNVRHHEEDNYTLKRQKTMDGLSYAMHKYLNIAHTQLRHKMTAEESNMFTITMMQELL